MSIIKCERLRSRFKEQRIECTCEQRRRVPSIFFCVKKSEEIQPMMCILMQSIRYGCGIVFFFIWLLSFVHIVMFCCCLLNTKYRKQNKKDVLHTTSYHHQSFFLCLSDSNSPNLCTSVVVWLLKITIEFYCRVSGLVCVFRID